jgi:fatty acid desaturase
MGWKSDAAAGGELTGEDQSTAFLRRWELVDDTGRHYRDFRKLLTPRWGLVWSQLALGYVALILVGLGVTLAGDVLPYWARIGLGAVLFGVFQAYIQLFLHEAAHYNFAPGRDRNDLLANVFIGAIHGLEIGAYRLVHFEHHRRLGTTMDSERAYFDPLNMRFLAEALLGIKGLEVLTRREGVLETSAAKLSSAAIWRQRSLAAVIHLAVIGTAVAARQYALAIAWAGGTLSVMPLFVALRQLLEHRSEHADAHLDYSTVDHGAVNRLFGDGPVASTLGGAGFNRHLLHHWEPQISYTRMRELEEYLLRTSAAEGIRKRQTTYWRTFWTLITW